MFKKTVTVYLFLFMLAGYTSAFTKGADLVQGVITASTNNICPGTAITFSAVPAANTTWLWYINGVSTGVITASFSASSFQNNDQVSCYITNLQGSAFSNVITVIVGSAVTPSVNITATSANICAGTPVTFTANAINGGTSPAYQWKVNGVAMGSNLNTYTTAALNNNDAVTCTLTGNAGCVAPSPVSSYSIVMNVSTVLQPKGKIIATANTVCAGTPVDFSMNMSIGAPVNYQWKINGNNATTADVLTTANLNDKDVISCDMLINTQCTVNVPFSASYIINVNPSVTATVNITASAAGTCPGMPLTFTASPVNAGNNVQYQWKVNNLKAGANSNVFTTSGLKNNDQITCQATPQNIPCLVNNSILSNVLTVVIYPLPTISLPVIQNVNSGNSIQLNPVISGNIDQYLWSPATGLSSTSVKGPVVTPAHNTMYTLSVISSNGCIASATTFIKVTGGEIVVNNTFTPNADGVNDTWNIPDLINYDNCTVDVFNRYGSKVFHSSGYPQAWDGSSNKKTLPEGTYYYIIDLKDGSKLITGAVTLIR